MIQPPSEYKVSILELLGEIEEYREIPEMVSNLDIRNAVRPPLVGSACEGCGGRCCTKEFGFTSLSLTRSEAMSMRFVDKAYPRYTWDPDTDDWLYPMTEDCQFREPTGMCSIYEERPYACRGFLCYSDTYGPIARRIRSWPELHAHLLRKGAILPPDGGKFAEEPKAQTREEEEEDRMAYFLADLEPAERSRVSEEIKNIKINDQ